MCVFLCFRVRLPMSCAVAESTDSEQFQQLLSADVWGCSSGHYFSVLSASRSLDQESYPYRIGTVHMCRDAAYADAGVRPGALQPISLVVTSLGLH